MRIRITDDDPPAGRDADVDPGHAADTGVAGGFDWAGDGGTERVSTTLKREMANVRLSDAQPHEGCWMIWVSGSIGQIRSWARR